MIHKGQSGTSVLSHNTQELGLSIKSDRKNIRADKKKKLLQHSNEVAEVIARENKDRSRAGLWGCSMLTQPGSTQAP